MESIFAGIIAHVIADGLITLFSYIEHHSPNKERKPNSLRECLDKDTPLGEIIKKAGIVLGKTVSDTRTGGSLRVFLFSPALTSIVRQIYSSSLAPQHNKDGLIMIRDEFCASLSLHMGEPLSGIRDTANTVFDLLITACDRSLSLSIEHGILSAHEAKSAARYRMVLDELDTINKNLAILSYPPQIALQDILSFEAKYRQQVGNRHAFITPPHFDAARKIPLNNLYVPPTFLRQAGKRNEAVISLKYPDFLSGIYRAVLLGNPGGGKSTLVTKICHDLSIRYDDQLLPGRRVTPVFVILRDYGADKKSLKCSLLEFIESTSNSSYQLKPPVGAFEYLLLNAHLLIIFDGLDELLDTSYRQEISADIESFCSLYPAVPVLVTSREIGYEQAPLDNRSFDIYRLTDFDDGQVQEYVKKWFSVDPDLLESQKKAKAEAFYEESQIVADIRGNPLMLALMCNIYRGENYIPKNRPDVYEKCAVMLFERWDKSRGLFVPLPFEAHISPAMKALAFWIYSDENLRNGVTERALIKKASEYLAAWRFEDLLEAQRAAGDFVSFCRGRAWVFTDTGTLKEGEKLYQFTHRTFLEYFTASHLVRIHPTPESLEPILFPRIRNGELDVVAQLAFQLQHKNYEGAGDTLLGHLISQTLSASDESKFNMLSFAARCLQFLVPRPLLIRQIAAACISACVDLGLGRTKDKSFVERDRGRRIFSLLMNLPAASSGVSLRN